ncbi:MAG TPA: MlaD family protein [Myxococcota bacterium]|nr:MlaD family protein [Myxococcota bacterium]
MTDQGPGRPELAGVADAVIETRGRPSLVWLIPLVAALIGAFVAYRAFSERGPEITITFKTAEGLEAGKTQIKYKDVEVGVVDEVILAPDLSGVSCRARMVKGAERWLTEKTQFWVVKPRISGGQVSGLGTLLSGSYIGIDPVLEGKRSRSFQGLEAPPLVTMKEPGRFYVLRSTRAGSVDVGTPVYYRRIQVGQVISSELDLNDDFVTTRIFVRAPYDERVHQNTRFWNASGVEVSAGANGVKIETESIVSILIGGIAFETPEEGPADVAAADTVYPLYENHDAAERRHYAKRVPYLLYFRGQSVRGLAVGAPVEFRGIQIGEVTDIRLEFDPAADQFRIPVVIEIERERFTSLQASEKKREEVLDRLVASGMRAQLKTGSFLTGQLIVALDIFKNAPPAKVVWNGPIPELPTIPTPLEEITANLTQLVNRLSKVPVEQIGTELQASLKELRITLAKSEDIGPALKATLEQAQRTLASTNALIGPDSGVNAELRRTLLELSDAARALGLAADQFQTQPDSLIFGKKGSR